MYRNEKVFKIQWNVWTKLKLWKEDKEKTFMGIKTYIGMYSSKYFLLSLHREFSQIQIFCVQVNLPFLMQCNVLFIHAFSKSADCLLISSIVIHAYIFSSCSCKLQLQTFDCQRHSMQFLDTAYFSIEIICDLALKLNKKKDISEIWIST